MGMDVALLHGVCFIDTPADRLFHNVHALWCGVWFSPGVAHRSCGLYARESLRLHCESDGAQ